MSTKKIRVALQALADTQDTGFGGLAYAALAEVEAIEKAARFITTVDTGATITQELAQQAAEASDTLERIAKDSAGVK